MFTIIVITLVFLLSYVIDKVMWERVKEYNSNVELIVNKTKNNDILKMHLKLDRPLYNNNYYLQVRYDISTTMVMRDNLEEQGLIYSEKHSSRNTLVYKIENKDQLEYSVSFNIVESYNTPYVYIFVEKTMYDYASDYIISRYLD